MRDRGLLLFTAGLLAAASYAFWHFLANDAFTVLSTLILLSIALDNFRLRRKLKTMERQVTGNVR